MKKKYYLLKVNSQDLIYDFFEEKYKSKKEALKALEKYKKKYKVNLATVKLCKDVFKYQQK